MIPIYALLLHTSRSVSQQDQALRRSALSSRAAFRSIWQATSLHLLCSCRRERLRLTTLHCLLVSRTCQNACFWFGPGSAAASSAWRHARSLSARHDVSFGALFPGLDSTVVVPFGAFRDSRLVPAPKCYPDHALTRHIPVPTTYSL